MVVATVLLLKCRRNFLKRVLYEQFFHGSNYISNVCPCGASRPPRAQRPLTLAVIAAPCRSSLSSICS
jgi:hypothetical protein